MSLYLENDKNRYVFRQVENEPENQPENEPENGTGSWTSFPPKKCALLCSPSNILSLKI